MQSSKSHEVLKCGFAPLIVILVIAIIIALVVLAFSYFGKTKYGQSLTQTVNSDSQVEELRTLGVSDEVSVIETDLDKTNLEKINQELPQVDKEASTGL